MKLEFGRSVVHVERDVAFRQAVCLDRLWRSDLMQEATIVEVYHALGGLPQRALLGGVRSDADPTAGPAQVEVGQMPDADRTAPGLSGRPFEVGLPKEFTPVVLEEIRLSAPVGSLTLITAAAHDSEQSSVNAFRLTAKILNAALSERGPRQRQVISSIWEEYVGHSSA